MRRQVGRLGAGRNGDGRGPTLALTLAEYRLSLPRRGRGKNAAAAPATPAAGRAYHRVNRPRPPDPPMRDHILLYVNGRPHRAAGAAAFGTLAEYLRRDLRLPGTKVVCNEGDCGSCCVSVGRPTPAGTVGDYRTVCSCIQRVYQLDGRHVVTVEGLAYDGGAGDGLNPVQSAMARCHGAQCGYCTPGFVVQMHGMYSSGDADASRADVAGSNGHAGNGHACNNGHAAPRPLGDDELRRGLVGNLCRCTGYEPILRAGREVEASRVRPLANLYADPAMAAALDDAAGESVSVSHGGRAFHKPTTLAECIALRSAHADAALISGGTDLGVLMNYGRADPTTLISTAGLPHADGVSLDGRTLVVGGGATLTQLERAAREHLPELAGLLGWFGSPPIKNAGTVAGNVATGSPIGDTLPAMVVLGAEVELTGTGGARRVPIADFYTGYRQSVIAPDELITSLRLPLPGPAEHFKLYKVSRRKDLDISTFSAAIRVAVEGGEVVSARIAYGGVGPTVVRVTDAEDELVGRPFDAVAFADAGRRAAQQVSPIGDVRGSDAYRRALAGNVLSKFFNDVSRDERSEAGATRSSTASVGRGAT